MSCLIDTNLLLRAAQPAHPLFVPATQAIRHLNQIGELLYLVPQNIYEFWVVATRPLGEYGLGTDIAAAQGELIRLKQAFAILPETSALLGEWERLVIMHQVKGKPAHDTRLVAAMNVHQIRRILTFNAKDFARFPDIDVLSPEQIAQP